MIPNQILNGIQHLDPLPVTIRKLTAMLRDEDSSVQKIADVVQYDAAVAANVLRVANSVAFAGRYPIERVRDAVVRLGTENLLTVVIGEYLKVFRVAAPLYELTEDDFYLHSAASALMIKAMTPEVRHPLPPSASIAALLHDIGKLLMVRYMNENVSALRSLCTEKKITFVDAERQVLGCDHAEVGGAMARRWEFPQEIVLAIENHHQVRPGGGGPILDAVMLANYAAKSMGVGLGAEGFNIPMDYAGSRARLGISIDGFERACAQAAVWVAEQRKDVPSAA
jgi:putative nucleotidyltransferase with HDIG domain